MDSRGGWTRRGVEAERGSAGGRAVKGFSVEPGLEESQAAVGLREKGMDPVVMPRPRMMDYREGKGWLHLGPKEGSALHHCLSRSEAYCCCNVWVLDAVSNCPFECSYCFLQHYMNDGVTTVVADIASLVAEVRRRVSLEPWRFFRIGTWDLGDSLALEPLVGTAAQLVLAFSRMENVLLELKTKSAAVQGLEELDHRGRTAVSWTMNPREVVQAEEYRTAPVSQRLAAMARVAEAGYPVGIHFDPMILYPGWERGYRSLVDEVLGVVPHDRIAWVSVGSLRFNPPMKRAMEANYPGSRATSAEMVLGPDGKMRYPKAIRIAMYRLMVMEIMKRRRDPFMVYLCMEPRDVWKRCLGWAPSSIGHMDYLMARSLHRRFPGLVTAPPCRLPYEQAHE